MALEDWALRLISLGLDTLGHKGGGVTACANGITQRLEALTALLRPYVG